MISQCLHVLVKKHILNLWSLVHVPITLWYGLDTVPLNSTLYIFEMVCDTRMLMGIGLVQYNSCRTTPEKIYSEARYNNYAYRIECRADRSILCQFFGKGWVEAFETALFTTRYHAIRGTGITQRSMLLGGKKLTNRGYCGFSHDRGLLRDLRMLFADRRANILCE